ncbi:NLRC3, partial [Symbiodinium sp. CCMP2456]
APGVEDYPDIDLTTISNNINECMIENLIHDLVHVYDWILLPASIGERYFKAGEIDLSRCPCYQLNGSFCALTAMRKTVQWYCQGVFDKNAPCERLEYIVRRRSTGEAPREWTGVSTGTKKQKFNNYFNRQFTDHISTQNGCLVENEVKI